MQEKMHEKGTYANIADFRCIIIGRGWWQNDLAYAPDGFGRDPRFVANRFGALWDVKVHVFNLPIDTGSEIENIPQFV